MKNSKEQKVTDQELRNIAEMCVRCMYCIEDDATHLPSCPSTAYFPMISYRPFGRLELARCLIVSGGEELGAVLNREEVAKRIFACTLCGTCELQCKMLTGKKILDVFRRTRRDLVAHGGASIASHRVLLKNILERGNPQGVENKRKADRAESTLGNSRLLTKDAPLLYFKGCVPSLSDNIPSLVANMMKILLKTSTKFSTLGVGNLPDEPCCGHVLINTGQEDLVNNYFKRVYQIVASTGVKQVLFTCPACYRAFKYEYPRLLGIQPSFTCITASEFMAGLIDKERLKLRMNKGENKPVVTYHDPCHLGRHSGIYEAPRHVLESIHGINFVELPRNRENAWCCGVGGGVKKAFPDFALETGRELIKEALRVGAKILVTACPACESGLLDVVKQNGEIKGVEVLDIVDLVAQFL